MGRRERVKPGYVGRVLHFLRPAILVPAPAAPASAPAGTEPDTETDSARGRQLLRELMERRRRNDLVRQREFEQLRRMRRLQVVRGAGLDDVDGATDSEPDLGDFPDTGQEGDSDGRAVTIRKINEIEEQMSRQWWKTRPAEPVDPAAGIAARASLRARLALDPAATRHRPLPHDMAAPDDADHAVRPATAFAATAFQVRDSGGQGLPSPPSATRNRFRDRPDALPGLPPQASPPSPGAPRPRTAPVAALRSPPPLPPGFGQSPPPPPAAFVPDLELPDMEPGDTTLALLMAPGPGPLPGPQPALPSFVHDPGLQDAAIEFANADMIAALASLHALLEKVAADDRDRDGAALRECWFALFDFYRALGRREAFETSAIAFAERFGRSPPAWVSLAAEVPPPSAGTGDFYWPCPALVSRPEVERLRADAAANPGPWWLDWSRLEGFEYDALAPLLDAFTAWNALPVQLYFEGADRLLAALEARTPIGAADAEADWWRLRMETLRLLRRMDDYEEAALDYCITYEVSPPSWQPPACDCSALPIGSHRAAMVGQGGLAAPWLAGGGGAPMAAQGPPAQGVAMAGEIGGNVDAVLAGLDAAIARQAPVPGREGLLVVDCTRLVRLDFVAAGSVLGWAASRHGEGLAVEFHHLHRLVGVFFNVTGISEYARVFVRTD